MDIQSHWTQNTSHTKPELPDIFWDTENLRKSGRPSGEFYAPISNIPFDQVEAAFGIALHMHQPMIPASSDDLKNAALISNLQYMLEHPYIPDNHNAPVFLRCYERMADIIPELVADGKNPRVMLDYSGNLLWGLQQIEGGRVLERLKEIACDPRYYRNVEWLGTLWSHAVVSGTPVPDIKLHIEAWLRHFASIFGQEALSRVKGFSPPEMQLPIHPDVCYEYVKALKEAGYEWLLAQEHTVEHLDGSPLRRPYFPHRLVAKNSLGQIQEISVLIKTQGSDTKLVGQMQPYYEAKTKKRQDYQGKTLPPYVVQISDGENGGVMMNEFPPAYHRAFDEITLQGVVAMNGSEYLELIRKNTGIKDSDFVPVQPVMQHRIWEFWEAGAAQAIERAKQKYPNLYLDQASWTNNISWVKGYENVLDPIRRLSVAFHQRFDITKETSSPAYREGLVYLLLSQTSCFRYWGEGVWTEYAKEICRRGMEVLVM